MDETTRAYAHHSVQEESSTATLIPIIDAYAHDLLTQDQSVLFDPEDD